MRWRISILGFALKATGGVLDVWLGSFSVNFRLVWCLEDTEVVEGVWAALEAFFQEVVNDLD